MTKENQKINNQNIFKFQIYRDLIKRFFDFLFSIIAIIILAIPMITIAILIKKSSPNEPVLFKQTRIGKNAYVKADKF